MDNEIYYRDRQVQFVKAFYDAMDYICNNKLDGTYYPVYLWLLRHRNYKDGKCYPSIATLSDELGYSKSTVEKKIKGLVEAGLIEYQQGSFGKENKSNSYYLTKYKDFNRKCNFEQAYYDAMTAICEELDGSYYTVYLYLLRHRNPINGNCFPSLSTLATETGYNKRTVQRKIDGLEDKEFIMHNTGIFGKKKGINEANFYYFTRFDVLEDGVVDDINQCLAKKKAKAYKTKR